jgi:hypothetical protein
MGLLGFALVLGASPLLGKDERASDSQKTYFSALQCPLPENNSCMASVCADGALVVAGGYFVYRVLQSPLPLLSPQILGLAVKCCVAGIIGRAMILHICRADKEPKPVRPN